jgi:hypothetical protein
MGLLDDAIKEHLDLKRRRGADPTEVERLAREALGPVRRGPETASGTLDREPAADAADEAAAGVPYPEEQAAHDWADPLDEEPLVEEPLVEEPLVEEPSAREPLIEHAPEYEAPRHHEIAEEWHAHEALHGEEPGAPDGLYEPFPSDEHLPADELPAEHQPLHGEGAGVEPDAHAPAMPPPARSGDAPPPAPATDEALSEETAEYDVEAEHRKKPKEGDDVLEETPEFLQDTPDHDRLWFEQRPPKDFDFDK